LSHPCHAGASLVSRSRRVPVAVVVLLIVVVVLLIAVAVVLIAELDRPNVTEARPHSSDIHSALPQLIPPGTHTIVAGINRLTRLE